MEEAATTFMDFWSSFTTGSKGDVKIHSVTAPTNVFGLSSCRSIAGWAAWKSACLENSLSLKNTAKLPHGGGPVLEDGEWCVRKSCAILRYMMRKYAEELYPEDPTQLSTSIEQWAASTSGCTTIASPPST